MSETNENKKTATERLEILENTVNNIIQAVQPLGNMAQDMLNLREAVKLLNHKLDATIECVNSGLALTDDNLSQAMTKNAAKELQDRVAKNVADGYLVPADTVSKNSFVVINEQDSSGKIVNPRMQFLVSVVQNEEVRNKLEGAKVGTNIPIGDKGGSLNVLEAYNVSVPQELTAQTEVPPAAEAAPATNEAQASATSETQQAPEAPVETATA